MKCLVCFGELKEVALRRDSFLRCVRCGSDFRLQLVTDRLPPLPPNYGVSWGGVPSGKRHRRGITMEEIERRMK